jgi:hypothetical protein
MRIRLSYFVLINLWGIIFTSAFAQTMPNDNSLHKNINTKVDKRINKINKAPNYSLSLGKSQDSLKQAYVNVGLMTHIAEVRGASLNVLSAVVRGNMRGVQLTGLTSITNRNVNGMQLSALFNGTGNNSSGLMISGLVNATGRSATGFQLAGLSNIAGAYQNGLAVAGFTNIAAKQFYGIQLSTFCNVVGESATGLQLSISNIAPRMNGVQISAISNIVTDELRGLQYCPIVNIASKTIHSTQLAMGNVCLDYMRGLQIGVWNYAHKVKGFQTGVINVCDSLRKGVQIGLINITHDSLSHAIGLVNITPRTRIQMLMYGGNTSRANVAARFMGQFAYSMLGFGTHYSGLNKDFSGCLFYRLGAYFRPAPRLMLSSDGGFYHIESFDNADASIPERMYSLQLHANIEYEITHRVSVFASGGYGWTRFYNHNKQYKYKPLLEVGLVLF